MTSSSARLGVVPLPAVRLTVPLVILALIAGPALLALAPVQAVAGPAVQSAPLRAAALAFRWPLDGAPRVVRRFDPPPQPWLPGHRGVDLAAAPGSVVRAAGPGVVVFAGLIAGRGVISVSHPGGLRTTYEPVEPEVAAGDRVDAGDRLGLLTAGHRGCPARACLHWGLRRDETYLDPLALLGLGRVRLLPARAGQASRARRAGRRRASRARTPRERCGG